MPITPYNNIKFYRIQRHLSQHQLAVILNKTHNRIWQWEHGKVYIRQGHKQALAQALNASVAQLFYNPPPIAPHEPSEPP